MIRCLCCNKLIDNPDEQEKAVQWHNRCIKQFFGVNAMPELDCSEKELEQLANLTVNKGLTVPGVQKKLSLHLSKDDKASRLTIVDYPTGYILKPQSKEYNNLPEFEFLTMNLAKIAKINVVPNALILTKGQYAYITKRVDRDGDRMYAMEDFCQLSGRMTEDKYQSSYEKCGKIIKQYSKNIGLDLVELYYRLLFCFVTGNSDMHLKNFSLIEDKPKSRVYLLSPAYDLLPVNIVMPADKEQMALTLNGKKSNITGIDFIEFADNIGIKEQVSVRLIKQIIGYKAAFVKEINDSYIPNDIKETMIDLVESRMEDIDIFG